ncbi:MAG: hypothetical protein Q7J65_09800 [Candidatus Marinimicrobia bacterium]|nr:hypothetical protein [Candidatus Neomarinimicrobiota bacterium]
MLIRIAPDMFIDPRFECVTIEMVCDEIVRAQKFKTKYPWRVKYQSKLKCLGATIEKDPQIQNRFRIVDQLVESDIVLNERNGRPFYFSRTDKMIAACALALDYGVSTVESELTDFLKQQFDRRIIKPLAIINYWLRKSLIQWDDEKQMVLEDWLVCNETPQDKRQIQIFTKLTKQAYPGP